MAQVNNVDNRAGKIYQTEYVTNIIQKVTFWSWLRQLWQISKIRAINRINVPIPLEELSANFFSGNLKAGSVVTVSGVLSRYSLNYKPSTFTPTTSNSIKITNISPLAKKKYRDKTFSDVGQIPVHIIPPINSQVAEKTIVCFLYPDSFNGFIIPSDPQKVSEKNQLDHLHINSSIKPIPVLLDESKAFNFTERKVKLTGVIGLLDSETLLQINKNLDDTIKEIFQHFYLPYSAISEGLCIDCRDETNSEIIDRCRLKSLPAAIYLDGHFDGLNTDILDDIASEANLRVVNSPFALQFSIGQNHQGVKINKHMTNGNVVLKTASPNVIGFYTETDLLKEKLYKEDLVELKNKYSKFHKTAKEIALVKHNININLKPDFIFDYRKSKLFYHKGVLKSNDLKKHFQENPNKELKKTVSWLNS